MFLVSFGENVLEKLRERGLMSWFRYAEIQAIKPIASADEMRAFLGRNGYRAGQERIEPLHFADLIEIELLKRKLDRATTAAVLFAVT